jgi:hypothetical protein
VAGGYPLVTMMNIEKRHGKNKPVIKKALVELDGTLFGLFSAEREKWALSDYFNMQGPVQYEFPTPRPYLAVPPTKNSLYLELDLPDTSSTFSPMQSYNHNTLTHKLSTEGAIIPNIFNENDENIRLIFSQELKYETKELKIAVEKDYPFVCSAQDDHMITFAKTRSDSEKL